MKTRSDLLFRLNFISNMVAPSMEWKSSPPALNPAMQLLMKRNARRTIATCDSTGVSKETCMKLVFHAVVVFRVSLTLYMYAPSCTSTKKRIAPNLCWMQPPRRNTVTWPPFCSVCRAEFVLLYQACCDEPYLNMPWLHLH